jgi:hypothetical protein
MKQYVIDQLRENDFQRLEEYLSRHAEAGELPGIYWIPLPERLYGKYQQEHTACQPFYYAINMDRLTISFELLIRTRNRLRCGCIGYATPEQRQYILDYADRLVEELKLTT